MSPFIPCSLLLFHSSFLESIFRLLCNNQNQEVGIGTLRCVAKIFPFKSRSDHDHERNLDHILEVIYDRDLISDHILGGTDRKKIRSLQLEIIFSANYCINDYISAIFSIFCFKKKDRDLIVIIFFIANK